MSGATSPAMTYNNLYQGRDRYRGDMQDTTATNYTDLSWFNRKTRNQHAKRWTKCATNAKTTTRCTRFCEKSSAGKKCSCVCRTRRRTWTPASTTKEPGPPTRSSTVCEAFLRRTAVYHSMRHEKHASYKIDGMDTWTRIGIQRQPDSRPRTPKCIRPTATPTRGPRNRRNQHVRPAPKL